MSPMPRPLSCFTSCAGLVRLMNMTSGGQNGKTAGTFKYTWLLRSGRRNYLHNASLITRLPASLHFYVLALWARRGRRGKKRKHGQNCDFLCSGPMPNKILICSTDIRGYGMHRSEGEERKFVEAGGVSGKKKTNLFPFWAAFTL